MNRFLLGSTILTVLVLPTTAAAQTTAQGQKQLQTSKTKTSEESAQPGQAINSSAQQSSGLSDIIVTAQRRSENVQNVPIPISAFSSEQLASRGVSDTIDLGQYVPNMIAMHNTGIGSANAYYIRGLGNTETIPTFDPPVGTYIDNIYISRQNANNFNLFDVERVEVLRGPQGTLFGRNTTGGAISVIMRKPEFNTVRGYAEVGYGSYNKKLARASIDLPLADSFAIKVSGYWQKGGGYVHNVTTGERLNDDDGWGARVAVRGKLSPTARWNGSYAYIEDNGVALLDFDCNPADRTQCDGRFATTGLRKGRHLAVSPYLPLNISGRKANFGLGNYTQSHLLTSNLEFDLARSTTLSFITGYVAQAQQYALDFSDGRGLPSLANPQPTVRGLTQGGFGIVNDGRENQFTQEVKLDGSLAKGVIKYVAGVFYIHENNQTDFATVFGLAPSVSLLLGDATLRNSTKSVAAYVQADLSLTDKLKLTAGIRYTDETKKLHIQDNRATCLTGPVKPICLDDSNLIAPSGIPIPTTLRTKLWTPRFAINFKPSEAILLYASATRGFKSGGWNARSTAPNAVLPFGPEKVWSYEAGIKSELFDRRVRANITAYDEEVTDLQTPSALVGPTGGITFLTRNFANYRNRGVEAELTFAPVKGLNLYVNGGYQNDKYIINRNAPVTDIYGIQSVAAQQAACQALLAAGKIPGGTGTAACAAGIVTPSGNIATPVRTPDFTLSAGGSYRFELSRGMSLVPSLDASWHSRQQVQTSNYTIYSGPITGTNGTYPANPYGGDFLQGANSEAVWLFNANLALQGKDDRWQLTAGCRNCLDRTYVHTSLANTTYINPPRTWTIKAKYKF